jgi:nitrogen PTS system EIIA component
MHFGATLRLLRLESGLSLRDLARRLNVSGAYLSRVENGLDSVPTPARIEAMARELGIPVTLLMDLAHRVSPLIVDYVHHTPEAGTLFLEIAHRRLTAAELAEVRAFVNERFPAPASPALDPSSAPSDLLGPDRVVVRMSCSGMDDVLDLAAGRLARITATPAPRIAAGLREREREVASAIGSAVAIPTVHTSGPKSAAALITLARPLEYATPDGKAVRLVVVLAGPRNAPERRVQLAWIARLASRGLAADLACLDSPAEVIARLALLEGLR